MLDELASIIVLEPLDPMVLSDWILVDKTETPETTTDDKQGAIPDDPPALVGLGARNSTVDSTVDSTDGTTSDEDSEASAAGAAPAPTSCTPTDGAENAVVAAATTAADDVRRALGLVAAAAADIICATAAGVGALCMASGINLVRQRPGATSLVEALALWLFSFALLMMLRLAYGVDQRQAAAAVAAASAAAAAAAAGEGQKKRR